VGSSGFAELGASSSIQYCADSAAPDTTIVTGPTGAVATNTGSFTFTSPDATATFECRVDANGFVPCVAPLDLTALSNGLHTFQVRAKDAAGNVDASPATASWTVTASTPTTPSTPAPVAAYSFNETSGTTARDSSGNGLNGTVSGATRTTTGKFGGALSFNGTNNMVTVADNAKLDLTAGMTLEAWVWPSAVSGWRTVVVKERDSSALSYGMYANGDTNRPVGWANVGGAARDARGTGQLAAKTWTHLATTYDGTTLRMYVNGTLVGSRAISGSIATSTGALRIGGTQAWGEWFNGVIDEVRVYDRALTQTQVKADMTKGI
jgi:hypothetical protein